MLRQSSFIASLLVAAVVGCGGLQNPNDATLATVSGELGSGSGSGSGNATVPANAHVALVWLGQSANSANPTASDSSSVSLVVSNDVPVIDNAFTMPLTTAPPADALFAPASEWMGDSSEDTPTESGGSASVSNGAPASGTSGSSSTLNVKPLDNTSGTIVPPLTVAAAGFIVYVDGNGDGVLTIDSSGYTPDTIVAGSSDLVLAYFQNGTDSELQDLADKDKQVPTRGYDLASLSQGRYLPLSGLQLTSGNAHLPSPVCGDGSSGFADSGSSGTDVASTTEIDDGGVSTPTSSEDASAEVTYPSPSDPNLQCSADGTYFYYTEGSDCGAEDAGTATPPSSGTSLCTNGDSTISVAPCASSEYEESLPSGPVPSNWPCAVTSGNTAKDAGSAPDAG